MKSYTDENGNLIWYNDIDDVFAKLENLNTECNSYTVAETRYQEALKEHDDKIRAEERAKIVDLIDRHMWNYSKEVWEEVQSYLHHQIQHKDVKGEEKMTEEELESYIITIMIQILNLENFVITKARHMNEQNGMIFLISMKL